MTPCDLWPTTSATREKAALISPGCISLSSAAISTCYTTNICKYSATSTLLVLRLPLWLWFVSTALGCWCPVDACPPCSLQPSLRMALALTASQACVWALSAMQCADLHGELENRMHSVLCRPLLYISLPPLSCLHGFLCANSRQHKASVCFRHLTFTAMLLHFNLYID